MGQDAALREKGLQQEDQEGWQGRSVALRRGQVYPEGPAGHVSVASSLFLCRHTVADFRGPRNRRTLVVLCALVVRRPPPGRACFSASLSRGTNARRKISGATGGNSIVRS